MRLYSWYAVCAALLVGHVGWFFAIRYARHADRAVVVGHLVLGALIVLLALLLATTPPDAIRLPRSRSERMIVAGAIALQLAAFFTASPAPTVRVGAAALAVIVVTALMLLLLRATARSAWAAALFAWNPLVVYETGVTGGGIVSLGVLLIAVALHWRLKCDRG